ncbi:Serine/threonine-protein kinase/endoribonuclease IRE1, partial [Lamellibrachia satsuma]
VNFEMLVEWQKTSPNQANNHLVEELISALTDLELMDKVELVRKEQVRLLKRQIEDIKSSSVPGSSSPQDILLNAIRSVKSKVTQLSDCCNITLDAVSAAVFEDVKSREKERVESNVLPFNLMNEDDKVFKYIATDLYDYTLSEWLNTNEAKRLSDEAWMETAAVLIKDLLQALEYLHTREEPILHRDLKPRNLFVVSNRGEHHMKVADFGLSRNIECDMTAYETKPAGTAGWMASEVLIGIRDQTRVKYRPSCDIQVAGMIAFYVMSKGKHPFGPGSPHDMENRIMAGDSSNLSAVKDQLSLDLQGLGVLPMLQKRHTTNTTSVCKLLRMMRNIHHHYNDQTAEAKEEIGNTPSPYKYFNSKFPNLMVEIYKVIKSQQDWTQRPSLQQFFPRS